MSRTAPPTASQTRKLCAFVADAEYEDLPQPVLDHATDMIVDTVAVALAATDSDPASVVRTVYDGSYSGSCKSGPSGSGEARVLGTGEWGNASDIALLDGVLTHALDFDDVHHRMGGHPSAPVLSALLPVAEREGLGGRDLLRSFVLGTEVELALADVLNPGHYERGWHPTAVFGTMGAAAAVGDLLDLDAEALQCALGIAASRASGMKGNFGTMTKPLHVGDAARNGQEAAELAAGGFTANPEIVELEFGGFCDLFQGDPGYDFADHLDRLGDPWGLLDPAVGFKPYPCCGSAHSAIDAALTLRERHDLSPEEIDAVRVRAHPRRLGHTDNPDPSTGLDGKFSTQYCVAVALTDGDVWLDHFDDAAVTSGAYRPLLDRVDVAPDRDAFADREWGSTVTVVADGEERTATVDAPKGSAERPMTGSELDEKFRRCASSRLDDLEQSLATLRGLEAVDDIGYLVDALV